MSATIGRNSVPDFDGADPLDSLGGFRAVGTGQMVDTLVLRALFARAVPAIMLYVL